MKTAKLTQGIIEDLNEENEFFNTTNAFKGSSNKNELIDFGKFEFQNEIIYIGFYKHGPDNSRFRHGKGKLIHPSSNNDSETGREKYEGDWVDDKMQGYGVYTYPNGDYYIGEFFDNKHHGFGQYFFTDGSKYEGQWENHKFHGTGKYTDINGSEWQGEFRNGEYMSKEQARLKEEKRIEKKMNSIKVLYKKFYRQWENQISIINNKNLKEVMNDLFANTNSMQQYVLPPYPDYGKYSYSDWDYVVNYMLRENSSKLCFNVPKNNVSFIVIDKKRVIAQQLKEELSSGQIIEIILQGEVEPVELRNEEKLSIKQNEKTKDKMDKSGVNFNIGNSIREKLKYYTIKLAIAYNKEFDKWLIVHFELVKN